MFARQASATFVKQCQAASSNVKKLIDNIICNINSLAKASLTSGGLPKVSTARPSAGRSRDAAAPHRPKDRIAESPTIRKKLSTGSCRLLWRYGFATFEMTNVRAVLATAIPRRLLSNRPPQGRCAATLHTPLCGLRGQPHGKRRFAQSGRSALGDRSSWRLRENIRC